MSASVFYFIAEFLLFYCTWKHTFKMGYL